MAKVYWHPIKVEGIWNQVGLSPPVLILPTLQQILRDHGLSDDMMNIENMLKYPKNDALRQLVPKTELPKEFSEFKHSDINLKSGLMIYVPIPWMMGSPDEYSPCNKIDMCMQLKRSGPDKLPIIQFFQSVFYMDIDKRRETDRGNVNLDDIVKEPGNQHHMDPKADYQYQDVVDDYPFTLPILPITYKNREESRYSDKWGQNPVGVNNKFSDQCGGAPLGIRSFYGLVSLGVISSTYKIGDKRYAKATKRVTLYDSLLWGADFSKAENAVKPFGPFPPSRKLLEEHLSVLSSGSGKNGSFRLQGWSFELAESSLKVDSTYPWIPITN